MGGGFIISNRRCIAYIAWMGTEGNIQVLPPQVANQIAAGEVVDRPASIVKELVENAIDAGASRIEIAVSAGGRKLISVTDNGYGMGREDAVLSIERHATSKIRDANDMISVRTLGFRGEALAAISSVSRFRLVTCRQGDAVGTELLLHDGHVRDVRDCGAPVGTRIEVRDLFYNVPARRKFLRTEQTEMAHIRDVFLTAALSHPRLSLRLTVDGKDQYRLAADGTLEDRIRDLFSPELIENLAVVDHTHGGVSITGFVSLPVMHRSDRNEQYLFVNDRPVNPQLLRYAIGEGYRVGLPKGRHPSAFLFLTLDPSQVDVNVHPTKREIRFRRPGIVRDCVVQAIEEALSGGGDALPGSADIRGAGIGSVGGRQPAVAPPEREGTLSIPDLPSVHSFQYPRKASRLQPEPPLGGLPIDLVFGTAADDAEPPPAVPAPTAETDVSAGSPWAWCRVLGQVGGTYVVMETELGLVLMDPRAAHERVLFERLTQACRAGTSPQVQALLLPETLTLTPRDAERVRKQLALFQSIGFGVSDFGGNSFLVDALPAMLEGVSAGPLIREMVSALEEAGSRTAHSVVEKSLIEAACHAAVGLRKQLTLGEIEKLVVDLSLCEMPYTSPRGRPTLILMSLKELHRKFGRDPSL